MKRLLALLLSLALLLTSCGRKPDPAPVSSDPAPEQSISSETPPEEVIPYGIEGLTLFHDAPLVNDLQKVAYLTEDAHNDHGPLRLSKLYDLGNGKAAAVLLRKNDDYTFISLLSTFDVNTGEVMQTRDMGREFGIFDLKVQDGLIWYWPNSDVPSAIALDDQLREVRTASLPCSSSLHFDRDGSCWYVDEGQLFHDLMDGSEPETVTIKGLTPTYLAGIFTDGEHTYGQLSGEDKDETYLETLVALDTNKILFQEPSFKSTVLFDYKEGIFSCRGSQKIAAKNWKLICAGSNTFSYSCRDVEEINVLWADKGRLLFSADEFAEDGRHTVLLWLYNSDTGLLEGMTRLLLFDPETGMDLVLCDSFLPMPDGSLLMMAQDWHTDFNGSGCCVLYRWYPDREHGNGMSLLQVEPGDFSDLAGLVRQQDDEYWNLETYVPGPLDPRLSDLKARANALGDKLGVNILIGDECKMFIGSYALVPTNDRSMIVSALEKLENETAKYPDGFFRQLSADWEGMDICLTGQIKGMTGYTLDAAGGVTSTYQDRMVFAINVNGGAAGTFHHELSHCIDSFIDRDLNYTKLYDSEWNRLNPEGFQYLYSYVDETPENYCSYSYLNIEGTDIPLENAWFVDTYAMNYATEDRARIMEYVMMDDPILDLDKCPRLQAKLNYFARCIRDRFDTSDWGEVHWEKYLKN